MHPDDKINRLRTILQGYGRIAVAFSGGIDSSLLARCALDVLGTKNVLLLFAESELLKAHEIDRVQHWLTHNGFPSETALERLPLHPLAWKEFVVNREDRCYSCKLRMYTIFREHMEKHHFPILADGTHADDLKSHRPGLRAIHELGVKTPLVEAGLVKRDILRLGQRLGLTGWDHPSDSCLATRIPAGMVITSKRLRQIERWEEELGRFGLVGCRVRLHGQDGQGVIVEIADNDFEILLNPGIRPAILRFFYATGVKTVLVHLAGR